MNKQQRQAYDNKRAQNKLRRAYNDRRDYNYTPDTDNYLTQGELIDAATMMLQHATTREKTANLNKMVDAYDSTKRGHWKDPEAEGYGNVDNCPPPNWPLAPNEWYYYNQEQLLTKAMTLIAHELERVERRNTDIYRYGGVALDPAQVEAVKKSKALADRKTKQQWTRRSKESIPALDLATAAAQGIKVPGPSPVMNSAYGASSTLTSTPDPMYANALVDELLDDNF